MDTTLGNNVRHALLAELHAATREKHHALNMQITARLPLCLPPHANNPLLYAKGMVVFGQIYSAFENFLEASLASGSLDNRVRDVYQCLHFHSLIRTNRLRDDVDSLKSRLDCDQSSDIDLLSQQSTVFASRITAALSARPHVLLAYAWAMYLALFNGGRWIRRQLVSPGSNFWNADAFPLSFWDFGDGSGEDEEDEALKLRFKDSLLAASSLLTEAEKEDVIEEAKRLFDVCSEMVLFLDEAVADAGCLKLDSPQEGSVRATGPRYLAPTSSVAFAWSYITSTLTFVRTTTRSAWERRVQAVD
ncbi:hypothetical protein LTR99_004719 [Exophiala xenobiotica]|uniref:Heme oxygenase n=1 Tax=Vermiconidia calcicola TaxID=1690605 RepID=A0AAV9QDD7_9PEZI|nr:hypothetical protein LTR41_003708 [Exophiala xenobiotica]KAK5531706.1 hypothetical protein LTR23_009822 [Chaetothyriales sp. CCFEE 6169]KAK5540000.1 hypothetical protein LTR25_003705 [Vermiconidia calcicola]KAK5224578.1 hypothetical protein LTR72_004359 [Exophiala xenobiotica]KAK5274573.1 hypothetical protein LTR96_001174 [Exophiala xenobiotica]